MKSGKFKFGDWLPDQPDLDNTGLLEASNTIHTGAGYIPYLPAVYAGSAFTGTPSAALRGRGLGTGITIGTVFVATDTHMYASYNGGAFTDVTPASGYGSSSYGNFAQFNELVILSAAFTSSKPAYTTLSTSPAAFTVLTGVNGDAPPCGCVWVVGQFVVIGNLLGASPLGIYVIQWSGINDPTNWPTPNTPTAIAVQSGRQYLDPQLGAVIGGTQGDQWGLVMMEGGIVRMTYIGGDAVFQFDTIYRGPGPVYPGWYIKVGPIVYFASAAGFFACDGTSVIPIGEGKVNNYFTSRVDINNRQAVQCGVDYINKIIYWTLPKVGESGSPTELMAYNYVTQKWTHVFDTVRLFVRGEESVIAKVPVEVIGTNAKLGSLTGSAGTASFITGESELNVGGKTLITGVRPQISGATLANIACKVSSRDNQTDALTTITGSTPDTFTGSSNLIVDKRYHRAEMDITGAFTKAIGGEFEAQPSSGY